MDELKTDLASAFRALTPVARWYAALTALIGLSLWVFADSPFEAWPTPVRCMLWLHLGVTTFAPGYIMLNSAGTVVAAWLAKPKIVTAHRPKELQATPAGVVAVQAQEPLKGPSAR